MTATLSFLFAFTVQSSTLPFFFFNDTATTEIYTLSLHDALPIWATIIQVRLKDALPIEVVALARALVGALGVPVIVNDRVDVALAAGAAGAHLGQEDPPLDRLRPHVPPGFLLGLSVGPPAEAGRGRAWPADYWSVGPCFATANKPDAGAPLGAAGFGPLRQLRPPGIPVIGIGGVTAANAPALVREGAAGVAVIGAVWEAAEPAAAARALRAAIA